jgi:hypothetical protein
MIDDISKPFSTQHARLILVVGIFDGEIKATSAVEQLLEQDFAADRISLLHKASGPGDDMLGLIYSSSEGRVKIWSKYGMIWGALWGLLAGSAGMYVLPIDGALTIVKVIGSSLTGAIIGGLAMAGAAVLTDLASAIHKVGIPKAELNKIHHAIEQDNFIVILHCSEQQAERYSIKLRHQGAEPVIGLPVLL